MDDQQMDEVQETAERGPAADPAEPERAAEDLLI